MVKDHGDLPSCAGLGREGKPPSRRPDMGMLSVRKIGIKELWTLKWHMQWETANEWTKAGGVLPDDWPTWLRKFKDY